MESKKAIVFGAGGFIGSHLVKSLKEEGFYVRGVDLKQSEYGLSSYADSFIIADLRNKEEVDTAFDIYFDEVYQLAADMGGIGYISQGNDADILTNSALINLNVVRRAHELGISGVFYSSSACIYPEENQLDPLDFTCEEHTAYPANPDTEYGWEKLFSERIYLAYNKDYGMKNKIGRYHNVFGPYGTYKGGKEKAPAALCRKVALAEDHIEIWGDGNQLRSFLYIDECVKGTKRLYRQEGVEFPINIGSTKTVTINELADIIIDIAGKTLEKKHVVGPIGVAARTSHNVLIKKTLNWSPDEDLKAGLKQTYDWIKDGTRNSI